MQDAADTERARLRWRCRRGMRELDVLLERWLEQCWESADSRQRRAFERLLGCEDDLLWSWLTGRARSEDTELSALVERMLELRPR